MTSVNAAPQDAGVPSSIYSAGLSAAQWQTIRREVRTQAERAGVAEAALLSAAEASGAAFVQSGRFDALSLQQAIMEELARQADQIADLERQLDEATSGADRASISILEQARTALYNGRLVEADELLAGMLQQDLSALHQADAEATRRRGRAATILQARGDLAYVQADYMAAAAFYERAGATAPQAALGERWRYAHLAGAAHSAQGERFVEPLQLHAAITTFDAALTLAQRPSQRAQSNAALAYAAVRLADLGDTTALTNANAALSNAQATPSALMPARLMGELDVTAARLAFLLYRQGDRAALVRAVRAYERAVEGLEDTTESQTRTRALIGLAEAYLAWGEEMDRSEPIDAAISQMRDLVEAGAQYLPDESLAYANMVLGVAYLQKMRRAGLASPETPFLSQRAASAFTAAERVFSTTPGTIYELALQNNIGQFFEFECQYEAQWRQRPLPYCHEALRRYTAARASLSNESALTRSLDDNIAHTRALIAEISSATGNAPDGRR